MELKHGSFSSLNSWLRCGHGYALQKKWGVIDAPAWYLMGGSAVHTATEWCDEDQLKVTKEDCADYFHAAFQDETMSALERWKPEDFGASKTAKRDGSLEDGEWWWDNGPEMVWTYVQWRKESDWQLLHIDGQAGVEFEMLPEVFEGFPIKMFIDRLFITRDGEPVIMDIKTGKSMPRSSLQLAFYAWGLRKIHGLNVDKGVFYNPRKGTMSPTYEIQKSSYVVDRIMRNWRTAVESDIFLPNLESCVSCNLSHACYFGSGNLNDPAYSPVSPLQNKGN